MLPDWQTLVAPRPLTERAIQLRLAGLASPMWFASACSADLKELPTETILTSVEDTRAGAFKFGQPRENFTLGRLAGKLALVAAVGTSTPLTPALSPGGSEGKAVVRRLRSFEIGNGERGEPVVRAGDLPPSLAKEASDGDGKSSALGVSLSHVNGWGVAVAFPAGERVGLDQELIDARRAETVRKGVPLSPEEESWLKESALPEAAALLLLWTARESLGKALGCGLACQWASLALGGIQSLNGSLWSGRFLHHPEFRCITWFGPNALMSIAFDEHPQALSSRSLDRSSLPQ